MMTELTSAALVVIAICVAFRNFMIHVFEETTKKRKQELEDYQTTGKRR